MSSLWSAENTRYNPFKSQIATLRDVTFSGVFQKLVDSVTMTDDAPKMIDVKYLSRCLGDSESTMKERRECGGLRAGNVVEFDIILKVIENNTNDNNAH